MDKTKAVVLAIIITAIVVGGGIYMRQIHQVVIPNVQTISEDPEPVVTKTSVKEPANPEPLSFSMSGISASVSKNTAPFGYNAKLLKSMAEECGSKYEVGYFDELVTKFNDANKIIYNFKYQGKSQDDGAYTVTLLPNKANYTSLDQFKKDFDICSAGGEAYPTMLNSNWLLFVKSCGTGFTDGSGIPHGCDEVRAIIEPSLKLN